MQLWAIERAEFRNAHFVHKDQPVPWTPEDVLSGDPAARIKRQMEQRRSQMAVTRFNAQLGKMKPGQPHPMAKQWKDADIKTIDWSKLARRAEA